MTYLKQVHRARTLTRCIETHVFLVTNTNNRPEDVQRTLIVDFQGRVVLNHSGFLETIDGSAWPSGMYTLIVQSKDGEEWVQRLVLKQ